MKKAVLLMFILVMVVSSAIAEKAPIDSEKKDQYVFEYEYNSQGQVIKETVVNHETGTTTDLTALREALSSYDDKETMEKFLELYEQASGGDMGAMYRLMRFITSTISRDKALQNIQMGEKLMELEENSRETTEELLDTPLEDGDESSKMMQDTKSEQDSRSVETRTNATKEALDARSRRMRERTLEGHSEDRKRRESTESKQDIRHISREVDKRATKRR